MGRLLEMAETGQALQARERLEQIADLAYVHGRLNTQDARQHVRELEMAARTCERRKARPSKADLAAVGMQLVQVPK